MARRLAEAFPDPADRAVALLRWYGAGSGRLTDRPAYEELAESALRALRTDPSAGGQVPTPRRA